MLFEVRNLTKVFNNRTVLDIPALSLERGKIYGLLGPNGAGKTTLLEILSFLLLPTTGEIIYSSKKVVFSESFLQALRREVVMVEQQPLLFTTSVYKNVEFGLRVRRVAKDRRVKAVHEALDLVGMRDFANVGAHNLSGGETQRVAIARALACSPKVVLLDEPTSNVDIENQIAIGAILRDINVQKGISVVCTTHNTLQAAKLSDSIVFLFNGRPAASPYENIFSGTIETEGSGNKHCLIHDKIRFPVETHQAGHVKISVDPKMISVFPVQDNPGGEHGFVGRVMQLTDEGGNVRALINIGVPLSVFLSRERYNQIPIRTGEEVVLFCPPESVEVIERN